MKGIINNGDYTFDASLQTVTLDAAYTGIGIENILLITNLVDGEIIYQFNNAAKSGTIAALVITLAHDTTAMADTDELMIIFDWDGINATVNVAGTITVGEVEVKNDSGNPIPVSDNGGSLTVDASSLPLPTGASTSANQTSEIALLTTIDADTSYLGSIDSNTGNGLARLGDIKTAVEIMDDWDESDRAKVNLIVGQAGVAAGSGVVGSTVQRVTIATDDAVKTNLDDIKTSVQLLDNAISGSEMQVDVVTMPTTTVQATNLDIRDLTFANDKVDASGSTLGANSGVDIGDVTINNAAGASAVNIQDGGNSITIDGSVTANAGTNLNTSALALETTATAIKDAVEIIDNAIAGSEMQVDIVSLPNEGQQTMANSISVAIASDQSAITVSGTVSVNEPVSIDDNGSSITVDGTVAVSNFPATYPVTDNGGSLTVDATSLPLPTGAATETKQDSEISQLTTLNSKDFATQTTLAAILAKIIAAPSTEAKQDSIIALLTTIDGDTSNLNISLSALRDAILGGSSRTLTDVYNELGSVDSNTGNGLISLQIMDDWDESDRAKVNLIAGQAGVDGNSGNKSDKTVRVVIATDQPNLTTPLNVLETAPTTIYNGKTTVTTAGTRVVLASSTTIKSVTIKALAANTGTIYVGDSTVASTNGFQLAAGDSVSLDMNNLNVVYIDSSQNGEGVTYIANN